MNKRALVLLLDGRQSYAPRRTIPPVYELPRDPRKFPRPGDRIEVAGVVRRVVETSLQRVTWVNEGEGKVRVSWIDRWWRWARQGRGLAAVTP
jgi:hypothetical protein